MDVLGTIIGLCLALFAAGWTYDDARKRGMTASSAIIWAMGVAVLLIAFLPLYLAGRPPLLHKPAEPLQVAQQLLQLEELKARGTLSAEEFEKAKSRLLADLPRDQVDERIALINTLLQQGRKPEALAAALQLQSRLAGQPEYSTQLQSLQTAISALSGPAPATPINGARILGGLILALGGLLILSAMNMDVSVAVPTQTFMGESYGGGRVNNIGLMNDRQNLMVLGSALGLGGLLLMLLGGSRK